jgi:hypothetical protein
MPGRDGIQLEHALFHDRNERRITTEERVGSTEADTNTTYVFSVVYGGEGGIRNITSHQISNELNEHGPIEPIDPIERGGAGMKLD